MNFAVLRYFRDTFSNLHKKIPRHDIFFKVDRAIPPVMVKENMKYHGSSMKSEQNIKTFPCWRYFRDM